MDPLGRASFPALGTDAVVLSAAPDRLGVALDEVRAEVAAIDRACSRFRDDSDLSRANARAGHPVAVDVLLLEAVEVARRAAQLTDGLVDPTVGDVVRVLGYDRDFAAVARSGAPVARVERVPGWRRIDVDRARGTLTVPRGASLDLGATAKALAADRAAVRASAAAGCGVLVSLGGDLSVAGAAPPTGWRVRVTDWQGSPTDAEGQTVRITDGGLATSSTTVRRWQRGGADVHHIVDPTTGGPAEVVWRTVSVAAADCVDANVAATAAIVRGDDAPRWLTSIGLPARLVHADGHVVHVNAWARDAAA
jgi:thiamine biosynthesis lipoprotein